MMKYALMLPIMLAFGSCSNTTETNVVDSAINVVETDSADYSDSTAAAEWPRVVFKTTAGNLTCLLYTSPSPRDRQKSRMPSSA